MKISSKIILCKADTRLEKQFSWKTYLYISSEIVTWYNILSITFLAFFPTQSTIFPCLKNLYWTTIFSPYLAPRLTRLPTTYIWWHIWKSKKELSFAETMAMLRKIMFFSGCLEPQNAVNRDREVRKSPACKWKVNIDKTILHCILLAAFVESLLKRKETFAFHLTCPFFIPRKKSTSNNNKHQFFAKF